MSLSTSLLKWQKSGQFHRINNYQIFTQVTPLFDARKATLLCLHGFPSSSYDWHLIWSDLNHNYNVIAPDFLGFGFSDKPAKHRYSIAEQTDIIEAILATYKISKCHILAHDYGTIVAQELLARNTKAEQHHLNIQSILFLNGALFPELHQPRVIQKLLLSPLGFLVSTLFNEKRFNVAFSEVFAKQTQPSAEDLKNYWQLIQFNQGNRISHRLMHYFNERKVFRDRWVSAMQNTTVPLAVINGLADPVSGQHLVDRVKLDLKQAKIYTLPNIGHYPQVEAPSSVTDFILDFIQNLSVS